MLILIAFKQVHYFNNLICWKRSYFNRSFYFNVFWEEWITFCCGDHFFSIRIVLNASDFGKKVKKLYCGNWWYVVIAYVVKGFFENGTYGVFCESTKFWKRFFFKMLWCKLTSFLLNLVDQGKPYKKNLKYDKSL